VISPGHRRVSRASRRGLAVLAFVCLGVVTWFVTIFLLGQQSTGAFAPNGFLIRLYPGSWSPLARGFLWLFVGAAAVTFDVIVLTWTDSDRGRRATAVAAAATGVCFLVFAIASFASAPWSVVH